MKFFSKTSANRTEPAETLDKQSLAAVEDKLRNAEIELESTGKAVAAYTTAHKDLRLSTVDGNTAIQLSAMNQDPQRQALEGVRDRALQKFHDVLRKRADLMTALGLVR